MDFKIKILCNKCKCIFELRPVEVNISKINCPNCSAKVPDEISTHILNGLNELGAVPETFTTEDCKFLPNDGFSFSVQNYKDFP